MGGLSRGATDFATDTFACCGSVLQWLLYGSETSGALIRFKLSRDRPKPARSTVEEIPTPEAVGQDFPGGTWPSAARRPALSHVNWIATAQFFLFSDESSLESPGSPG